MRITITGGTGFLGEHLALKLVGLGHFPTVVARGINPRAEALRKVPNINFLQMSLSDDSKLFHAFNNCDAIAHLAGINRETNKGDFEKAHVESTLHVVNAARKAGVQRILYVSYLRARPGTSSRYLQTKWEAEEMIRQSGLAYTILKPPMLFGRHDHMISHIAKALDMLPIFAPVGIMQPKIRPVAIQDMLDLMYNCLVDGRLVGETVAVLGPEELTLGEAVKRIARVKKKSVLILPLPTLFHFSMAAILERISKVPLVSVAQVKMLSEGMSKPLPGCDELPDDLKPKTYLTEEVIRSCLPPG